MTKSKWNADAASGIWNDQSNWTPEGVPTGEAVFSSSSQTQISFSDDSAAQVTSITFEEGAAAYSFEFGSTTSPALTITGDGVFNHSRKQQSFVVAAQTKGRENPQLEFTNSASAGGDEVYYCSGPENQQGYGGGVISFLDNSNAGSAYFKVWTGAGTPPKHNSTVGGEVSFSNTSSASNARFVIYGSLSLTDGDTFGNVVFHDTARAAQGNFTNIGGTVSGGDGGNTQFYGSSSADNAIFNNFGGIFAKANGGDVAFDATSSGSSGKFYNHPGVVEGAYGGVTSFNNNWPDTSPGGASAGKGSYYNYGASQGNAGGGGHLEFSARYGSPTGEQATIANYGSDLSTKSSAGHTVFSINLPTTYFPTAGDAVIYNHPALSKEGAAGFTEFSIWGDGTPGDNVPTAGNAKIYNLGGTMEGASGGYTSFSNATSAGKATLIAYGGTNSGYGGKIAFYDNSTASDATIKLYDDGELDISYHTGGLTVDKLELSTGSIAITLGTNTTALTVSNGMTLNSDSSYFYFRTESDDDFELNTKYTILKSSDLSQYSKKNFKGNSIQGVEPRFSIRGDELRVKFKKPGRKKAKK